MNTEKVKSADEIAEEIGQWFYGGTDEKRMMLVHRIKNAIESERRKKDESYAKLEAEKVALEAELERKMDSYAVDLATHKSVIESSQKCVAELKHYNHLKSVMIRELEARLAEA